MRSDMEGSLDRVFRDYREACPDPDGSAEFMPGLWRKIEAKRSFAQRLRHLTRVFVTASAAACLAMSMMLVPHVSSGPSHSYLDLLDDEHYHETLSLSDNDDDSGDLL